MKPNFKLIKSLLQNRHVYPTVIIVTVDICILCFLIIFGLNLHNQYNNMLSQQDKVQQMKATINLIKNNRALFEGNLTSYNNLLEQLIPSEESYFSVISSLEQLSQRTGVTIHSYSVNLNQTTEEKLTLTLQIKGDKNSLQHFIQEYKYGSGRLIISEKMNISPDNLESLSFSINFFHNKFKDTVSLDSKITNEDLQKLDEIKAQQ